jgi:biotin synthase-related radical SAM superfamily protein
MALRKALARATALRAMAACPVSARGAATTTTTTIGRASADATASALARSHAHGGAVAAVARARRAITTRNQVENEIYDRSRQEIPLGNRVPSTAVDAWIAPNATIAGDVDVGNSSTVWHGAVL